MPAKSSNQADYQTAFMLIKDAIAQFNKWRNFKVGKRTVNGDDLSLRYFCMAFRNCNVEQITLDGILDWLNGFQEMEFDQNTIQKKCITLRKFFEFLTFQKCDVIDPALIPMPKHKFVMPRVANDDDFQKMMAVIPTDTKKYWHIRNRALILMQSQCGARIGEMLSINTKDLDADLMGASIYTEKSRGKRPFRKLMWRSESKEALCKWLIRREELMEKLEIQEKDALFIALLGGKNKTSYGRRLSRVAIPDIFRKYSNAAGLSYTINSHSLRHKFGRDLVKAGADNSVISSLLGHSQLSSSYPYTELFGSDLKNAYHKYTN